VNRLKEKFNAASKKMNNGVNGREILKRLLLYRDGEVEFRGPLALI